VICYRLVVTPIAVETQTLYAELLEQLLALHAERSLGRLPGSFTEKNVKGEDYLYFQVSQPGGSTKQFYLGRKTPALVRLVDRFVRDRAALSGDLDRLRRLTAQVRAGGVNVTDTPSGRVLRAFSDSGLFEAGAVLVGTHAFVALGNLLGIHWGAGAVRTQDVDLASNPDVDIDVALPDVQVDVPAVLESLKLGFLPVPSFDAKEPSTSFKVRGHALRVDLLCPKRGPREVPLFIKRFNAAAQPLEFLDYLVEAPERAVVVSGDPILVKVPAPARFAMHKLVVAGMRPATLHTKAEKDRAQAGAILEVLVEDRPGDIPLAWKAATARGGRFKQALKKAIASLQRQSPRLRVALPSVLGGRRFR
jgi:hypothetical protein